MRKKKLQKKKNIHDLTLGEILINTKNTYLDIINELLSFNYPNGISSIFTKENRIFYIGVSLLIISFLIYVLSFLFDSDEKNEEKVDSGINIYVNSPDKKQEIESSKSKITEKKISYNSESATESIKDTDKLKINNKVDTSDLKVVEL